MAYSVDKITKVETWSAASEFADDGSLDVDVSTCMVNGVTGTSCDEWKEGILNCKVEINQSPSTITALSIRFFLQSIMTGGNNSVVPYTDTNSVSGTNANEQSYNTGEVGTWVEHVLSAALIAELGDVGGKTYLRLASEDTAKSKISEVQIDMTYTTYEVTGISLDADLNALGSCEVSVYKSEGSGVYTYAGTTTSNATTGVWTIGGLDPGSYFAMTRKADTPNVFDCTDLITATVE